MDAQVRSTDAVMSNGSGVRTDVGSRPEDAPPAAMVQRFDPRTRVLLEGPITSTLLRLATPNVLVVLMQASVGLIETYFVGKLGTDALAGVALVFPALMLMQMMSAGAVGGGISAAIARALGAECLDSLLVDPHPTGAKDLPDGKVFEKSPNHVH